MHKAPDDCDWNAHLSNSAFAKNLDPLRMRVCMEWFPAFFADGGWVGLAGEFVCVYFLEFGADEVVVGG